MCVEAPQAWFEDIIVVTLTPEQRFGQNRVIKSVAIDPLFCETVEAGSLVVTSIVPDEPVIASARIHEMPHGVTCVMLSLVTTAELRTIPRQIVLTIRGIRKGRGDRRFPRFTDAQMRHNTEFWQSAHGG